MDYQDVKQAVMKCLEDNLEDPDENRRTLNKKWIYDDLPRPDITSYPRIGIESPNTSNDWMSIGGKAIRKAYTIMVAIYVDKKRKLNVGGSTLRDHQILAYLTTKVKSILLKEDNIKTYFVPKGVYAVLPRQETFAENDNVLLRQVFFEFVGREAT